MIPTEDAAIEGLVSTLIGMIVDFPKVVLPLDAVHSRQARLISLFAHSSFSAKFLTPVSKIH